MTFDEYIALIEGYEQYEDNNLNYSFSEQDLELVKKHPEHYRAYLVYLSTRSLSKSDEKRLNSYLRTALVFTS